MNRRQSTQTLVFMGMFVAVIAALSQISVPTPSGVPITLQTFAVALAAYMLGGKPGAAAVAVYLLLGAVGVPVFSNFRGGAGMLFGVTGGFLWGFLFLAFLCGTGMERQNRALRAAFSVVGLALCHLLGVLQYMAVMDMGAWAAFSVVSLPYLFKDAASLAAAYLSAITVRRALHAAHAGLL